MLRMTASNAVLLDPPASSRLTQCPRCPSLHRQAQGLLHDWASLSPAAQQGAWGVVARAAAAGEWGEMEGRLRVALELAGLIYPWRSFCGRSER